MRQIALDVHQTFCEVAIREGTKTYSAGRVATEREALELFAESLCPTDEVAMEATGPAMEIARARDHAKLPRSDHRNSPGMIIRGQGRTEKTGGHEVFRVAAGSKGWGRPFPLKWDIYKGRKWTNRNR